MNATHTAHSAAMTAAEFRSLTESLGLDQRAAARLLRVEERTVRRWIAGSHPVPAGAAADLRKVEAFTAEYVAAVVAALIEDGPDDDGQGWLLTFATDAAYRTHHPDAEFPASWHRAAMGRVRAAVPWARLHHPREQE